ncbi:tetratricopeptide repeat protein [Streptomyces sp. NPDC093801]|uniref:tetratricopeptide repeat protein n=1 Tax=Streptomyces sp. NPDC093801 TaxID=3155203 RepID=UPI0034510202
MPTSTDGPASEPAASAVHWPLWSLEDDPASLASYVLPETVARHLRLPAGSDESAVTRLRTVWAEIAGAGIRYAHEPPGSGAAGQPIRPPAEVLVAPANATCLDLALVLAAACGHAGLPAAVVIVERGRLTPLRHALVVVALAGQWPPGWDTAEPLTSAPPGADDHLRPQLDRPRPLAALDPVGLARSLGTARTAHTALTTDEATASGHRYLTSDAWGWRLGLRVAGPPVLPAGRKRYRPAPLPAVLPLGEIHPARDARPTGTDPPGATAVPEGRDTETGGPALRLLRPEYRLTPFQPRDELPVLTDLCEGIARGSSTGLVVLHGDGGSGKTRLALEAAAWLRQRGWYAGPLREGLHRADPTALPWLATVTSPLCVVVDYADTRVEEVTALLSVLRGRARSPAAVLLTSRSAYQETPMGTEEADWLRAVLDRLITDGHPHLMESFALPLRHPHGDDLYDTTLETLTGAGPPDAPADALPPGAPAPRPDLGSAHWSTLDLVLLARLVALGGTDLPTDPDRLYRESLRHEQRYWAAVHRRLAGTEPRRGLLQSAAACLTLLAPPPEAAADALTAVPELAAAEAADRRRLLADTFTACLRPAPGEGLAVRPDRVGDHLMVTVLHRDLAAAPTAADSLLERALAHTGPSGTPAALGRLNRAGQGGPLRSTGLIETALTSQPARWRPVLELAMNERGAAAAALENLVDVPGGPLPVAELADALPRTRLGLVTLARKAASRRLAEAGQGDTTPAERARLLAELSQRRADEGDLTGSLAAMTETVALRRTLARAEPAVHLADLAQALNDQAVRRAQTGDRLGALEAATEAVAYFRQTAAPLPDPRTRSYAGALSNLAAWLSEAGRDAAAADTAAEAVALRRRMYDADPAEHRPGLADALTNLAAARCDTGRIPQALDAAEEAVEHYRVLAARAREVFAPDWAAALTNLGTVRAAADDPAGALTASELAVTLRREFTADNPSGLAADLARALWNLSNRRRHMGDDQGAADAAEEALRLVRPLHTAQPAAYAEDLAGVLLTLARARNRRDEAAAARTAAGEAARLYADLATGLPDRFAGAHARALIATAIAAAEDDDLPSAAAAAHEAVAVLAPRAASEPERYDADLADAHLTLSQIRSLELDTEGAAHSVEQAVRMFRAAALAGKPDAQDRLARALRQLSAVRAESGELTEALAAAGESCTLYRGLAAHNTDVHGEDLAESLTVFALVRARTGDHAAATELLAEAVRLLREAPASEPAVRIRLATALQELAHEQVKHGDVDTAAEALAEALELWGDSAGRRDLGTTLTTLARLRLELDDTEGAYEASARAVAAHRTPTGEAPEGSPYEFADALDVLAECQARTGEWTEAGESAAEAVQLLRRVHAAGRPRAAAHLAEALNVAARVHAGLDDRASARATIEEAVRLVRVRAFDRDPERLANCARYLYLAGRWSLADGDHRTAARRTAASVRLHRKAASVDPQRALPGLVRATGGLADISAHRVRLLGPRPAHRIAAVSWLRSAWAVHPPARGNVLAASARWCAERGSPWAAAFLRAAARSVQDTDTTATATRARREIRAVARILRPPPRGLPEWALAPVPPEDDILIDALLAAPDWPRTRSALLANSAAAERDTWTASLRVRAALDPGHPRRGAVAALLARIRATGLPDTLAAFDEDHERTVLLDTWLTAPTWAASFAHLTRHADRLTAPAVAEALVRRHTDPVARQHLAVLRLLTTGHRAEHVRQLASSTARAAAAVLAAVEDGDAATVRNLADLHPRLLDHDDAGPLLRLLLDTEAGRTTQAVEQARSLAEDLPPLRQRAMLVRLRRYAAADPQRRGPHTGFGQVLSALTGPSRAAR